LPRARRGSVRVIASGFTVADDDALTDAERELERRGFAVRRLDAATARSRRVRSGIAFDDPFGNRLELVTQQELLARPVAFGRASGITEFGRLDRRSRQPFSSTSLVPRA
jgi:2,3-dihydroxy-p-cumate/2,3-dihydroxybenzoate 3,4-dioxygenase